MLLLWGHLLPSDTLQFGYKVGTSTTQCSWLVTEVVNHFLVRGTNPIITLLDCSKAFDMVKFSILFNKLIDRGLPPIVVRTLMVVYEDQYAWVKWGGTRSSIFPIINVTRQGSILSPALLAVYVCKRFAARNNLIFSTDPDPSKRKTKCIFVTGERKKLAKVLLANFSFINQKSWGVYHG